jgi:hypothetical protein
MIKTSIFIVLCFLISLKLFGQKERFVYQPRLLTSSIKIGLVNSSLNLEYRLNPKTISSIDFGIGIVRLHSNYYNKYNENYGEYNKYFDDFLNFWREWWSPYTSIQAKRIISSLSSTNYESAPYANTFTYYGLQLKYNGHGLRGWIDNDSNFPFRETYQFAALLGRQVELGKKSNFLCDIYIGVGGISNYNLTAIEPKILVGLRMGLNLWNLEK